MESPITIIIIGTEITVSGSSFGNSGTVTVGSVECVTQSWGHSVIICQVAPGMGTYLNVQVEVESQTSLHGSADFSYDPPVLVELASEDSYPTDGSVTLTITGSSLGTTGTVTVGSSACAVTSYGHSTIECSLPAGQGALFTKKKKKN